MPDINQDGELREKESVQQNKEGLGTTGFMSGFDKEDAQQSYNDVETTNLAENFNSETSLHSANFSANGVGAQINREEQPVSSQSFDKSEQGMFQPQQVAPSGHYVAARKDIPKRSLSKRINRGMILLALCVLIVIGLWIATLVYNKQQNIKIKELYESIEPVVLQSIFPNEEYSSALKTLDSPKNTSAEGYDEQMPVDLPEYETENAYLNKKKAELLDTYKDSFVSEPDKNLVINKIVFSSFHVSKVSGFVKEYSEDSVIKSIYAHNDGVAQFNIAKSISYTYTEAGFAGSKASSINLTFKILAYKVDDEWKIITIEVDRYDPEMFMRGVEGRYDQ